MSGIISSDESDFETLALNKSKQKVKKHPLLLLSDDEDCQSDNKSEIPSETNVKDSYVKNGSLKRKSHKPKGTEQLTLLSFSKSKLPNKKNPLLELDKDDLKKTECPICFKMIHIDKIEEHADSCADSTPAEVLELASSQENGEFISRNLFDSDIFESDLDDKSKNSLAIENNMSTKRQSWNLESSFDRPESSSNPSKRKKTSTHLVHSDKPSNPRLDIAPYPEFKEGKVRGCLRSDSNYPGMSIQNNLKGKQNVKQASPSTETWGTMGKIKADQSSNSFGFKLHPFLAKDTSSDTKKSSDTIEGALVPDGEGGFIVNESAISDEDDEDEPLSNHSSMSNGFIDFKNQFKENSTPRGRGTTKRTRKLKKSPRKRGTFARWRGRGSRGNRGRRG